MFLILMKILRKYINRLLSKGMSNIYLKATIEKTGRSQNFVLKKFKILQI